MYQKVQNHHNIVTMPTFDLSLCNNSNNLSQISTDKQKKLKIFFRQILKILTIMQAQLWPRNYYVQRKWPILQSQ